MLLDRHRAKIVTPEELAARLGPRPRKETVVMCHGVFDVVHPGHLRHLIYAKSKADTLVCSITSDRCADRKGAYRPHVPQEMRAQNLAAYDFVDYVVVCDADRPDGLIARLEPDLYAKGFEYSGEVRPRTIPEAAVVEAHGGEVLFTPGDVVYSSTELIAAAAPDLRWDKLEIVMRSAGLTFDDLRGVLASLRRGRVHVVGDAIVDGVIHCEMIGTSGKTPTLSVRRDRREDYVGGAGIVAKHARAAGASVQVTTVVGDDSAGLMVLDDLRDAGCDVYPVVDRSRPTTLKEVVSVGGYRLLKIDTVDSRSISDGLLRRLCEQVADSNPEGAVVFSDFRHGIFNARTIPPLVAAIPVGCLRVADSQVASRWGNVAEFVGFDLITPNEREARFALGDQDSGVRSLAHILHGRAHCRWLMMKLGARGMLACAGEEDSFVLDSFAGEVVDAVGAGDAFLAYATLALLQSPSMAAAAVLGSFAAAVECEYDGNVPVAPERVLDRLDEAERVLGS